MLNDHQFAWDPPPLLDDPPDPPPVPDEEARAAAQRFRGALASGNPRRVRAAAAELPDIGLAEAAAILLVIEATEPENYERAALDWLARLSTEGRRVDLRCVAEAALALAALPSEPRARMALAEVCVTAGAPEAAAAFAGGPAAAASG